MRKDMLKATVRMSFIAIASFTLLAANPSTVAATTVLADENGPSLQQQSPASSGSGSPVQRIPGNAGTGDASKGSDSKSKSKDKSKDRSKDKSGTDSSNDAGNSGHSGSRGNAPSSVEAAGTDSSNDAGDSGHSGSRGDNSEDSIDNEKPGTTGGTTTGGSTTTTGGSTTTTGGTGQTGGTITVDTQQVGGVTVRTETTTFVDGSRIIRIFRNDVLIRTVQLGAGDAAPAGVLGTQQAPAAAGTGVSPTAVAGQQSAADIAMLPATTPALPAAPIGILGASLIAAGAWVLRRGRKA